MPFSRYSRESEDELLQELDALACSYPEVYDAEDLELKEWLRISKECLDKVAHDALGMMLMVG